MKSQGKIPDFFSRTFSEGKIYPPVRLSHTGRFDSFFLSGCRPNALFLGFPFSTTMNKPTLTHHSQLQDMPPALLPFQEKILETRLDFIRISPEAQRPAFPWSSSLGGRPYLPKDAAFPVTPEGESLYFLAQINFEETPALAGFPNRGLLQFFVFDDPMYGWAGWGNPSGGRFKVLYYPDLVRDPEALTTDFSFLRPYADPPLALETGLGLSFSLGQEFPGPMDYRFDQHFGQRFFQRFGEDEEEVWDFFFRLSESNSCHKIGGYAYFTQEDPRTPELPLQLLLQLDSDSAIGLQWGDMGIAHFFIPPADLTAMDFSNVSYHWDCS
jgi:uncharacterized protein YwqG